MSYILNIETATENCSVSLGKSGELIALKELNTGSYSHSEKLHVFIENIVKEAMIDFKDIVAVCVGKGPGSYTGLRIGVSATKGICFALDIPIISIETLNILAYKISVPSGFIVPLIDARRSEVYSAVFTSKYKQIRATEVNIIDKNSFLEYLEKGKVYFLGSGSKKCKDVIKHKNALFIDDKTPSAADMVSLSFDKYRNKETEDLSYFEPYYLKDFVVKKPQKK